MLTRIIKRDDCFKLTNTSSNQWYIIIFEQGETEEDVIKEIHRLFDTQSK